MLSLPRPGFDLWSGILQTAWCDSPHPRKNALLKPCREFGASGGKSHPFSLLGSFSALNSDISVCLASLCIRHMNLHSVTDRLKLKPGSQAELLTKATAISQHGLCSSGWTRGTPIPPSPLARSSLVSHSFLLSLRGSPQYPQCWPLPFPLGKSSAPGHLEGWEEESRLLLLCPVSCIFYQTTGQPGSPCWKRVRGLEIRNWRKRDLNAGVFPRR